MRSPESLTSASRLIMDSVRSPNRLAMKISVARVAELHGETREGLAAKQAGLTIFSLVVCRGVTMLEVGNCSGLATKHLSSC